MLGIDVRKICRHVFAAGIALAVFGGTAMALVLPFRARENVRWLAWSFLVVIIGGLGSLRNRLLAGLAVGLIEAFIGWVRRSNTPTWYCAACSPSRCWCGARGWAARR